MAKTTSPVGSMPLDIVEIILDNLELVDIKNTRLAYKPFCHIGLRFKGFFAQQTTDLSVKSLQRQKDLASHPQLGPAVTKLVVMAAVFDTSELNRMLKTETRRVVEVNGPFTTTTKASLSNDELVQAASDLKWIRNHQSHQRFQTTPESIAALSTVLRLYGKLDTIELDACVTKTPSIRVSTAQAGEWQPVFVRASEVYQITMSAIALSKVLVNTLLIYREPPRCSVTSFDVTSHVAQLEALPSFTSVFSSLKNFAISFSTRVETDILKIESARDELERTATTSHNSIDWYAGLYEHEDPEAIAEENFPGIAYMLRQMPNLDALDLHMLDTLPESSSVYQKVFEHVANDVKLPLLTQVLLQGLPSSEDSLLKFFDNHRTISDLAIEEIHLTAGSWKRVIKQIFQLPHLSKLYISNLFDDQGLFNLLSKGAGVDNVQEYVTPATSHRCGRGMQVHTRIFGPKEIELFRQGLEFDDTKLGRAIGSPQLMRWGQIRELKYSL